MGREGVRPLPVCERCRHFLCREEGVGTCGPCRKAYQLSVSVRNVIPADRDESAVVFYEGCFGLLQDWLKEIKSLDERKKAHREDKPRATEKPSDKPERVEEGSKKPESRTASRPSEPSTRPTDSPKNQPLRPDSHPSSSARPSGKLPLPPPPPVPEPPQGSRTKSYSSQTVLVPRPSHRDPDPPVERSTKPETASPKDARVKPALATEGAGDRAEALRSKRSRSRRRRRRERSNSSPSSKGRERRRRRRDRSDKKEKGRRRRKSASGSTSVTGSRVREAKRSEAPKPAPPVRPPSPHTPPGPPPAPPPVQRPPTRTPPVKNQGRPVARQGPGWIGRVPWSNHPRWWAGKNKGVTRRAKQELFNRRR